jgi:uncharacterized protein YaiI (UPF0178 family)
LIGVVVTLKIIVDADAAPKNALDICREAAARFSLQLVTVANFNHRIESDRHVVVGDAPQEADIRVINLTGRRDIVVTQDWGLAAMILGKGAFALSPAGRVFQKDSIEFLLEEREMKARFRRGGGRTRGPKKRTAEDDQNFKKSLYRIIENDLKTSGK